MPQGWITRVEKDLGYVSSDGGATEKAFKHWALAAEMGGRYPPVGSYVQYREIRDAARGPYITEVRQLTPPQAPSDGRHRNVYADPEPVVTPGIARMVEGERVPLEQALRQEQAEATAKSGIREVSRPAGPLHPVVATEWTLAESAPGRTVTDAPQATSRVDNVLHDGHTVTVTVATSTQDSLPGMAGTTETA